VRVDFINFEQNGKYYFAEVVSVMIPYDTIAQYTTIITMTSVKTCLWKVKAAKCFYFTELNSTVSVTISLHSVEVYRFFIFKYLLKDTAEDKPECENLNFHSFQVAL
jgi:hypothetical protein